MKDKLQVAVIFSVKKSVGGNFRQELNAALRFKEIAPDFLEIKYYSIAGDEGISNSSIEDIEIVRLKTSFLERLLNKSLYLVNGALYLKFVQFILRFVGIERKLKRENIDLIYFLSNSSIILGLSQLNFMTSIHDLCHLDHPEFPEVRNNGEFEVRQKYFKTIIPKATILIADSYIGKEKILKYFSPDPSRVVVMPFSSFFLNYQSENVIQTDLLKKYNINKQYVFYPAQFWPHKNHYYILEALYILKNEFSKSISVVFSGGDKGNIDYIKQSVRNLDLSQQVHFVGFVNDHELEFFYRNSIALVMPSYFGPTNLPPLEAFSLGTPVIYPNEPDLREQVSSAALLMDLQDPMSLASHLNNLITIPSLREDLSAKGIKRLDELKNQNDSESLKINLKRFLMKRRAYKSKS